MGTDIANWLQVNIVNNPQILQSLIALIILIVANFLFSKKPTEKIPFRRVLGAFLFVFGIFIFLYANIADLADVFIAWATIVLAGAALLSFAESGSLRKQYREREERDRKERLLNEIIDWAIDVSNKRSESKKIFKEMVGITDTKRREIFTYAHVVEVKESYVGMSGKNRYIENITPESEQDLRDAVVKLIDDVEAYIEFLGEWGRVKADAIAHNVIKEEEYIAREGDYTAKADEHVLQLEVSTSKVIEEAAKIKTRDIS